MKRISTIILSVAAISSMLFVGCKKDTQIVTLGVDVEKAAADSKLYIDENHNPVFFQSGESVSVNGTEYNIEYQGGKYYVPVEVNDDGNYYAAYPASITTGFTGTTNQPIHFSRWQAYEEQDGVQNIKLPSVAAIENNSGKKLHFYNLCSMLEVQWTNTSSDDYDIIGMEVTVPGVALYGDGEVTIDGTDTEVEMTGAGEKYNRVNLDIPEDMRETVEAGAQSARKYYICLPPFENKQVSVRIFVMKHDQTTLDDQKLRTVTFATSSAVTLPRNYIVPMHKAGTPKEDNGLSGYFSVRGSATGEDSYKVVFSRGNLQHVGSTNPSSGTWQFAARQYDFFGQNNVASGYYNLTQTEDLFAWSDASSNGQFGMYPYDYWYQQGGWTPSGTSGEYFKDWGTYKTISGDAPQTWFTLNSDEWYYLFHTRVHENGDNLRGKAMITGIQGHQAVAAFNGQPRDYIYGFILMPDDWTSDDVPAGLSFTPAGEDDGSNAYVNTYTVSEWARLEAAGAMFLPAAGYGNKWGNEGNYVEDTYQAGYYWSRTRTNNNYAYAHYLAFQYNEYKWHLQTSSGQVGNHIDANYDMEWWHLRSVRLVKPAPGFVDPDGRSTVNTSK